MRLSTLLKTVLAISFLPLALHAQDTLRQQHEAELAKAATPLEKAVALNKLGRFPEALSLLRDAARLTPDDPVIQLNTAIVLDHSGDHAGARQIYDVLRGRFEAVWQNYAKARKAGVPPPKPSANDASLIALSSSLNKNDAVNYVFLGQYSKALSLFQLIYSFADTNFGPDKETNCAALWILWLTAKMRAADGLPSKVALEMRASSLAVSTPYHEAMLKFYQGKLPWSDVLAAISATQTDALTKERYTTEAHFFAAGYFRYVKRDNETALKLLTAQDALPYNGVVERLFIRNEIASLKK